MTKAYGMCLGVANAAPQTHATIVATMVIPSGTGAVVVPTVTITAAAGAITAPVGASSTAVQAAPATPTSSPISTISPDEPSVSRTSKLTTAQIAGISGGVAAAVGLAIGLIFLIRCIRRRRYRDRESGLLTGRGSRGFGLLKSNQNSPNLQISAPIHKTPVEMDFKRPGDRESILPGSIGLAISRPNTTPSAGTTQGRPLTYTSNTQETQELPKPTLTLTIPQTPGSHQQEARVALTGRESIVTEFAEDGEPDSATGAHVWRPPPSDPQSATTYYVADKWGNWILGNQKRKSQAAELEVPNPLTPTTKSEKATGASPGPPVDDTRLAPSLPARLAPAKLGSPIVFKDKAAASGVGVPSSIYSNFSVPQSATLSPGNHLPRAQPPPSTYFDLIRESGAGHIGAPVQRRNSRRASRPVMRNSYESGTTIESAGAGDEDDIDDEPQEMLSPVVESPQTPISPGTSPVSYPRIPGAGSTPARHPTPNKGPAFSLFPAPLRASIPNGHRQLSSTPGVMEPVKSHRAPPPTQPPSIRQPLQALALNLQPNRNPAHIRNGSPEARSSSAPPEQQQRRPSPQTLRVGESANGSAPSRFGSIRTPVSAESYNSNASSLLSKRLGADRAAALVLGVGAPRGKWRRDGGGQQQGGAPGFVTDELGHVALPATPGWQPKLTLTRRGEDLFLNVQ